MVLLKDLCSGKLQSRNIVIKDTYSSPARHLLMTLLHSALLRYDRVLLVATERPAHFYINTMPASLREKIQLLTGIPQSQMIDERLRVGKLIRTVLDGIQGSNQRMAVIMDSVSTIVWFCSATAVPQLIKSLLDFTDRGNQVQQVVSVVHIDAHEDSLSVITGGQPDTVIELPSTDSFQHQQTCHVYHKDTSHLSSIEKFNISEDFLQIENVVGKSKTTEKTPSSTDPQTDPTANLTFNLTLKPEEKEARNQVVLPYTQASNTEEQGGTILYVPDDADDFDEEDPDEDLDF